MSKFIERLNKYYESLNTECDKGMELDKIANEFKYMHSYMHPKHNKRCHCFMRPLAGGYNIVNVDDEGQPVEGVEEAENVAMTSQQLRDLEAVGAVAGDKTTGVARKQINYAYLTLLNKLSKKVKDISAKI
jgi:hypothetical protein